MNQLHTAGTHIKNETQNKDLLIIKSVPPPK